MSLLTLNDPQVLATTVADSIVAAEDHCVWQSGMYYWRMALPWTIAVTGATKTVACTPVHDAIAGLIAEPDEPGRHWAVRAALLAHAHDPTVSHFLALGWEFEKNSRVGYRMGAGYQPATGITASVDGLLWRPPDPGLPVAAEPEVLVVILFRERDEQGRHRLRNLLACLQALRNQSFPRAGYQVTIVEYDNRPRWRHVIDPYYDIYLSATKSSAFNQSWGANVRGLFISLTSPFIGAGQRSAKVTGRCL